MERKPPAVLTQSLETVRNVCDLDLDSMTLVLKLHLNILVTYLQTEMRLIAKRFNSYDLETLKSFCYLLHMTLAMTQ